LRDGAQKQLDFLRKIGSRSKIYHFNKKILNKGAAEETISVIFNFADPFDVLQLK